MRGHRPHIGWDAFTYRLLFFIFGRIRLDLDRRAALAQTGKRLGFGGVLANLLLDGMGDFGMLLQELFGVLAPLS